MKSTDTQFGRAARLFHWGSALLILLLLATGFRAGFSSDATTKIAALTVHIPLAMLVLVITILRLIWWWRFDRKPLPIAGQPRWQVAAAHWTHRAFYLLILVLVASGIGLSALSGLPDAVFGAAPFPALETYPPRAVHGIAARLLFAALILHIGAALYHHLIVKDRTLLRMWSGKPG